MGGPPSTGGATTTVVIVRHAERDPGLDPPPNAVGVARAEALKEALKENGVTAIYCTDLIRNRDPVQPLADEFGITRGLVSPPTVRRDTAVAAETVVNDILADHAGGTVLFCGNIGSVLGTSGINEESYARLGGAGTPPVRYQDLRVVVLHEDGAANIIKSEYGGPSAEDPS